MNQYPTNDVNSDDIDLIKLFLVLWSKKWHIIVSTFLIGVIVFIITSLLPQKWTSKALVLAPAHQQFIQLSEANNLLSVLGYAHSIKPNSILNSFLTEFNTPDFRKDFIVSTDYFKTLSKDKDKLTQANIADSLITHNFSAKRKVPKKDKEDELFSYYELSISTDSAKEAQALLVSYIDNVNKEVVHRTVAEITHKISSALKTQQLAFNYNKKLLDTDKAIKEKVVAFSLKLADTVGIKYPLYRDRSIDIKDDPDFPISLGTVGLKEKFNLIHTEDPSTLNGKQQKRLLLIQELSTIDLNQITFQSFRYLAKPTLPVKKDSPKRKLLTLIGLVVGFLLSAGYVLLNHTVKSYKATHSTL